MKPGEDYGLNSLLPFETHMCLGVSYRSQGDLTRATQHSDLALQLYMQTFCEGDGNANVRTARAHVQLASLSSAQGRHDLSMEHAEKAIRIYLRVGREMDPELAYVYSKMGLMCKELSRGLTPTVDYYRKALHIYSHAFGEGHTETAEMHVSLAHEFNCNEQPEQAEPHFLAAYTASIAHYGDNHEKTAEMCFEYGNTLKEQGKLDAALLYLRKALSTRRQTLGPDHESVSEVTYNLFDIHIRRGNFPAAIEYLRETHAIYCVTFGHDHELTNSIDRIMAEIFATMTWQLTQLAKHAADVSRSQSQDVNDVTAASPST